MTIVASQSSIDWRVSSATSLVKDQGQNCRMYSTTEGIAVKTQQIISCDTTDDDCNGVDLITVFNYVMDAGVSSATLITRSRAIEEVMLVATTAATTTEVNKL